MPKLNMNLGLLNNEIDNFANDEAYFNRGISYLQRFVKLFEEVLRTIGKEHLLDAPSDLGNLLTFMETFNGGDISYNQAESVRVSLQSNLNYVHRTPYSTDKHERIALTVNRAIDITLMLALPNKYVSPDIKNIAHYLKLILETHSNLITNEYVNTHLTGLKDIYKGPEIDSVSIYEMIDAFSDDCNQPIDYSFLPQFASLFKDILIFIDEEDLIETDRCLGRVLSIFFGYTNDKEWLVKAVAIKQDTLAVMRYLEAEISKKILSTSVHPRPIRQIGTHYKRGMYQTIIHLIKEVFPNVDIDVDISSVTRDLRTLTTLYVEASKIQGD